MKKAFLVLAVIILVSLAIVVLFISGILARVVPTLIGLSINPAVTNIAVTPDLICFMSSEGNFYAVNPNTHRLKWSLDQVRPDFTVIDNTIYVSNYNGELYLINASTGKTKRTIKTNIDSDGAPIITKDKLILHDFDKSVYCFNLETGARLWKFTTRNPIGADLAAGDGIVCVGTSAEGFATKEPRSDVYALDIDTGKEKWSYKVGETQATATIYNGVVYFASPPDKGGLDALDAATGKKLWHFDDVIGSPGSKPVVLGDTVYVCSGDGPLYAVDIRSGQEKWHTDTFISSDIFMPVVLDNDTAYFSNADAELYAINRKTGKQRWSKSGYGAEGNSNPAVLNGVVYIGGSGKLYALNAKDGSLKWEYRLPKDKTDK